MIVLILLTEIYFLHLLLKLSWWSTLEISCFLLLTYIPHKKLWVAQKREEARFEDVCIYLDTLLYSFLREGKIIRAFEDVYRSLPAGEMKEVVCQALEQMEMVNDETQIYKDAMKIVEKHYFCRRVQNVHDFLLHVEYFGGEVLQPIELLIEDKNRWQVRVRDAIRERKHMLSEIVMSIVASLIICGSILYLPVGNMNIGINIWSQLAAVAVIVFNEFIFLRAQKYLAVDWLIIDDMEEEKDVEKKMKEYRLYDEQKGRKQSLFLALIPIGLFVFYLWKQKKVVAAIWLAVGLMMSFQHRLGHFLAGKHLTQSIQSAFPKWLMDLILLLQSENVHVALVKSEEHVPIVLKSEVENLVANLEMNPESVEPYHNFLREFAMPEVYTAMSMLFSLSNGSCGNAQRQISELIARNLEMMDSADHEKIKNKSSGMYLLFLAPVFVGAMKLLVDMAVFLFGFLTTSFM